MPFYVPQQLRSLIVLFVLLIVAFIGMRHRFVPETFGEFGHYRAAAVDSVLAQPIRYAGREACRECHDDIDEVKKDSFHRNLSCEVCHGPAAVHVEDPGDYRPPAPRERGYCPLCHGYNPSRPTGFPQIEPIAHNPMKPCIRCHNPHDPKPPHVPERCSACHRNIYRTKAVSHHASLACTRCHQAPAEHRERPSSAKPSKPSSREFCGGCHGVEAASPPEIPRIDLEEHYPAYVCWQCHYPHYPEAR